LLKSRTICIVQRHTSEKASTLATKNRNLPKRPKQSHLCTAPLPLRRFGLVAPIKPNPHRRVPSIVRQAAPRHLGPSRTLDRFRCLLFLGLVTAFAGAFVVFCCRRFLDELPPFLCDRPVDQDQVFVPLKPHSQETHAFFTCGIGPVASAGLQDFDERDKEIAGRVPGCQCGGDQVVYCEVVV